MKSQIFTALKIFTLLTLLTGVIYPVGVTLISQVVFNQKANGSLLTNDNKVIGSELIGQSFKQEKYFFSRPSAIEYNPLPSGGTNLGPTSSILKQQVENRAKLGLTDESLFASGSGLDPHISFNAAISQLDRIVNARQGLAKESILSLVNEVLEKRDFGILGEERINVLKLNLALDRLEGERR
jgi:K+-transporting ATPase ATPase C chain